MIIQLSGIWCGKPKLRLVFQVALSPEGLPELLPAHPDMPAAPATRLHYKYTFSVSNQAG